MGILKEAREQGLDIDYLPPNVHCTMFKDNSSALDLTRLPKICTKHINQLFHHFREHVERQDIIMLTEHQIADILNKPLAEAAFTHHRKAIIGW